MKDNKLLIVIASVVVVGLLAMTFLLDGTGKAQKVDVTESDLSNDPNTILTNAQSQSASISDSEKRAFTQIDVYKYLEYYAGSEAKLVLVARPTCGYCQIAEPILQNIAYKYNVDINYLNTDEFNDDTQAAFIKSDELFSTGFGTPLLLIVQNNSIVDKVDGLTDYAHYVVFLQNHGFIQ